MKFSHLADSHVGSWRDPRLKDLSLEAFLQAIDESISQKVNFVLISGDLFNTALPSIEHVKLIFRKLKTLKDHHIPLYFIAGSHDFSPSGKTMLDIIEEAGLGTNVMKGIVNDDGKLQLQFTEDKRTGAKITGILGRKGMLDKKDYENLSKDNLESEDGFKIFMFHTSIDELKPDYLKEMESSPLSFLPRGFDYYAGGHVHITANKSFEESGHKNVIYPGPTFPASFSEMEKLGSGSFYLYDNGKITQKQVVLKDTVPILISVDGKSANEAKKIIEDKIKTVNPEGKIILIRIYGTLKEGKISDLNIENIINELYSKNAYFIMKNTSKLLVKDFSEIRDETSAPDEIEEKLITAHLNQIANSFPDEKNTTKNLIKIFSEEKNESEKNAEYEKRIRDNADEVLK
jgi:DNA repair protein SbcD/Mre11